VIYRAHIPPTVMRVYQVMLQLLHSCAHKHNCPRCSELRFL